jgi:hypothetical protein
MRYRRVDGALRRCWLRDLLGVDRNAADFGAAHVARFIPAKIDGADIDGIEWSHFSLSQPSK